MKEVSFQESKFVEKFTIFASKMGNEIHLRSLRDAFATIMPLYILAGLAVLINNTVFVWLLSGDTLTGAQYWGTVITNGTLNISSLLIAPVIGYCLSRNKGFDNPMAAAIVSLAALVVMMPNVVSVTPLEGGESVAVSGALTFGNVGTQAMFAGVIIGLIATELFVWISGIKKLQIDLGDSIPPSVGKSFNVLIPFILLLSGFGLISAVLNNVFDTNLIQMITTLIQEPLRTVTTGLVGCVILYSLGNFWFNSKTLDTCLLKVTLTDSRIESMTFIPAVQSGCYTSLAEGEEGQRVISYMNSLSTGVFIGSDGSISRQE